MYRVSRLLLCFTTLCALSEATIVNTNNAATVAAFQSGATVVDFENISGITPQAITAYTAGAAVSPTSFLFNQVPGVQFSVGGMVGTNEPAVYKLGGGIAGDAKSGTNVLGPVDFDFTTKFNSTGLIEIFFPTKVSKVGFWLNPSLGNVSIIVADTNFAFSHEPETNLETGNGTAGSFVAVERATADIGGFKIQASAGTAGFTIDDFTFGGASTTTGAPEPATFGLIGGALLLLRWRIKK